jgi:hypothetical protein
MQCGRQLTLLYQLVSMLTLLYCSFRCFNSTAAHTGVAAAACDSLSVKAVLQAATCTAAIAAPYPASCFPPVTAAHTGVAAAAGDSLSVKAVRQAASRNIYTAL